MSNEEKDLYKILDVSNDADADTIKKSYRKLAMKYHPDRNKDDKEAEAKFKEISFAYDILKDEQKRSAYDRYGLAAFDGSGGGGAGGGFDGMGGAFSDIFEDMFGDFMGGGRSSSTGPKRGSDMQYKLEISLEEAHAGKSANLKMPINEECDACNGSGAEPGTSAEQCTTCHGSGRIRQQQGFFTIERTCTTCDGNGVFIKDPCKKCSGSGRIKKNKNIKVKIPAGIESGRRIRVPGEGEAGVRGGSKGDLYILVMVKPHKLFKRDTANLYCRVPIPVTTAALGGSVEVPTLSDKKVSVKIPAGSQTGQQIRLREKGMTIMRSEKKGDLFIELFVETPVKLTKEQEELMNKLDKSFGNHRQNEHSPESGNFFQKMKEFWEDLKD